MLLRNLILGPILACAAGLNAFGQNATYNPPYSSVGTLQYPGIVGRSDPMQSFGRVGGATTGRFDIPQSPWRPQGADPALTSPNRGFRPMGRPRGIIDPTEGIPGYRGASNRIPSNFEFRPRQTNSATTFENNRMQSFATRHQIARNTIGAADIRSTGVLADWDSVMARRERFTLPVERLHSNANLLRPKSALGQILSSTEMAIYDAAPIRPGHEVTPNPNPLMLMPEEEGASLRAFDNAMAERLRKKYEDYKAEALAFFKTKNYVRARDCVEICRGLDRKSAWPCAIDTFVAMETRDYSRAFNSLLGAIKRAEKLEDIQLVIQQLYGDTLDFEKSLNLVSNLASDAASDKVQPAGQLLLSFFAWHNKDLPTAVSAAQAAARTIPGDDGESVKRYADQLKSLMNSPDSPK